MSTWTNPPRALE